MIFCIHCLVLLMDLDLAIYINKGLFCSTRDNTLLPNYNFSFYLLWIFLPCFSWIYENYTHESIIKSYGQIWSMLDVFWWAISSIGKTTIAQPNQRTSIYMHLMHIHVYVLIDCYDYYQRIISVHYGIVSMSALFKFSCNCSLSFIGNTL